MSSDEARLLKQIKIKTGVVKRLSKEKGAYEKELEQQRQRVEKFRAEGRDGHEIKKQEEVLQESRMMIPDCLRRLNSAVDDLKNVLQSGQDLTEQQSYKEAETAIEEARKVLADA